MTLEMKRTFKTPTGEEITIEPVEGGFKFAATIGGKKKMGKTLFASYEAAELTILTNATPVTK